MKATLLRPDSAEWHEVLASVRHDFYHLPEYVKFAARRQDVGEPHAFVAEESGSVFFLPLIVRRVPAALDEGRTPLFDATGPRGYPGPLVSVRDGRDSSSFVDRAVGVLAGSLRERGVVSAYVRLHPLLTPPLGSSEHDGSIREHGSSVSVDLTVPDAEQWRRVEHGHRLGISKALRNGYRARCDETWERFDDFVSVYQQSMKRLQAAPFHHHSAGYFLDLRAALGRHVQLLVVERGDELASAGLFTETDGLVEYHLSGTADSYVHGSPSKLLVDFARRWAASRGNRVLHLGGSLRPGDSLAQFKTGFSPLCHQVRSWRLVADRASYDGMVARAVRLNSASGQFDPGYFPAYRAPLGAPA